MNNFEKIHDLLTEKKIVPDAAMKQKITQYQVAQHKQGNKISWDQAKDAVMAPYIKAAKEAEKAAKAAKRAANPRPKKDPSEKTMSTAQFERKMKAARKDFQADFGTDDDTFSMGDIAWDVAGSLMYDPEIDKYVRKHIAKAMGITPDRVKSERVQEYIADHLA